MEEKSAKFCSNCGAEIDSKAKICPKCGVEQLIVAERVSGWWYVVPLFLGIIGGLVAWLINKDRNSKKAMRFLIAGIVVSILWFLVPFISGVLLVTTSLDSARETARDARRQADIRQISIVMEIAYDYDSRSYPSGFSLADIQDELAEQALEIPQDPQGGAYEWMDNTRSPEAFCAYAELEGGGFIVASPRGVEELTNEPRTLADCAS